LARFALRAPTLVWDSVLSFDPSCDVAEAIAGGGGVV
jgi:hypothetical protein